MTITLETPQPRLIVGVDTHQRAHHAVIIDTTGRRVADAEFAASAAGYREVMDWAAGYGQVEAFGVESTGSYGAGLTRQLLAEGMDVFEVNRPDKTTRARQGKSDAIDAEHAARAVLAGTATGRPKVSTGVVEAVRALLVARSGAVKARTAAVSQLRDLVTTAPEELRELLLPLTTPARVVKAAALRPDLTRLHEPAHAARHALRALARRIQALDKEMKDAEKALAPLVATAVPTLVARPQIGTLTAAQLLVTAGQNLDRFRSEAAFAKLTGTAPLPASSGKTRRMRLNRGGDRQANKALHLIAVGRLKTDP
ncbi:IS110 family transposase [Microbacterium album]|uniref:IS110 family transposase n=1 Tax=Microbacterium album TaxID=2053191 RepID=A0A917IIF4_9MICO|nr:IS110 family transposase [Microbacterium album]GGH49524.1 IS110 family transposase [Microbacterium album]